MEVGDIDTGLLHGIALTQGDGVVLEGLMVDSDTERGADGILTAVALADRVFLLVVGGKVELEFIDNLTGLLGQAVLAYQMHDVAVDMG